MMKQVGFALMALVLAAPGWAEDLVQREVLNEQPLSGAEGTVVIVSELKLMPGGRIPLHTHPGDEHAVVVVGGRALLPNGKEVEFAAGTPMFFPEGQVHGGVTNLGDAPMEIVTTHIVRADAPFTVAAE
ncbi:cupin domain-containing protein [Roseobacter sinensis]|uniref:Cupin domain-containing protein n=1 Tax=Roseobacter sinensis TaxID=2931391 RepID=A0ABT3B9U8_9RHOB|nr:cupin domain-containing protein [Roseobacter sp. WL0113]MCV3270318.1 cupin domain-containing protein [Roseobacter sp. WL0113]